MSGARLRACLALLALLAACAGVKQAIDPQTAKLERFKQLSAAHDDAAIASEEVRCQSADRACRQLHLLKGDACFALGRRGDAPRERYECAILELGTALDPAPADETRQRAAIPFAEKLMEALRLRRDLSASHAESTAYTAGLVDRARAFRAAYPEHPAGYYYEASGLFGRALELLAIGGASQATCADLETIRKLLSGPPGPGRYAASIERITRDALSTQQAECRP